MKILTVVGARPQFIKSFPVSKALLVAGIEEVLVHTGQHYDHLMSDIFFDELGLSKAKYNLEICNLSHGQMTGNMIIEIEKVLIKEKPDLLLIYGDTNSTLAAAMAAVKMGIKIAHIESGLRSKNMNMPEEINRVISDRVSDILFCSSSIGRENLMREGIEQNVHIVGDVMYDSIRLVNENRLLDRIETSQNIDAEYIILTMHRASLSEDINVFEELLNQLSIFNLKVIFPAHPRISKIIDKSGIEIPPNVSMIEPLGYLDMMNYLSKCKYVVTDSGGIQKEAYWMKKPCFTIRNETEWVETVYSKWNTLVFDDIQNFADLLKNYNTPKSWKNLYGDGCAAEKIVNVISEQGALI